MTLFAFFSGFVLGLLLGYAFDHRAVVQEVVDELRTEIDNLRNKH